MGTRTYKVKEVASMAGVTVRALHHYDAIGLLVPSARTAAGYRLYADAELVRLHQILLYRELGLPLEKIRSVMDDPAFDPKAALLEQREQLLARGRRTQAMLCSVDRALRTLDGGNAPMNRKDLFDGFNPADYEEEAKARWGETEAYRESARRTKSYTDADWIRIKEEAADILERLATKMRAGVDPTHADARALAEEHRLHIDRWFYPCSPQMYARLAVMYVADPRFTATFDKVEPGLATYLRTAVDAT